MGAAQIDDPDTILAQCCSRAMPMPVNPAIQAKPGFLVATIFHNNDVGKVDGTFQRNAMLLPVDGVFLWIKLDLHILNVYANY